MSWGSIASTAITVGAGYLGAKKQAGAAKQAAAAATPRAYDVSTPYGQIQFDHTGRAINAAMAESPFMPLLSMGGQAALMNAFTAPGSPWYGAPPELIAAAQGFDPQALAAAGQGEYDILTQLAAPEEQRQRVGLQDTLFSQGRLGTSGGAEQARALAEAQSQADLQRRLAGIDRASSNALNRFNAALGTIQTGGNLAAQNYNVGTGAFSGMQDFINNFLQSSNIGLGAGAGTPWQAAVNQAQSSALPYQSVVGGLQNAGVFDKMGEWIGGKLSSPTYSAPNTGAAPGAAYSGTGNIAGVSSPFRPLDLGF